MLKPFESGLLDAGSVAVFQARQPYSTAHNCCPAAATLPAVDDKMLNTKMPQPSKNNNKVLGTKFLSPSVSLPKKVNLFAFSLF